MLEVLKMFKDIDKWKEDTADYIVKRGTSGIWTYEKWYSGIVKAWGVSEVVSTGALTKSGSIYYKTDVKVATIPKAVMSEIDQVVASYTEATTVGWLSNVGVSGQDVIVTFNREQSGSTSVRCAIQAVGKWK